MSVCNRGGGPLFTVCRAWTAEPRAASIQSGEDDSQLTVSTALHYTALHFTALHSHSTALHCTYAAAAASDGTAPTFICNVFICHVLDTVGPFPLYSEGLRVATTSQGAGNQSRLLS